MGDVEGYDGDMDYQQFSTNPVGCGPYVFEEWNSGVGGEFRASAFTDYHGGEPAAANIQDAILSEPNAIYNGSSTRTRTSVRSRPRSSIPD